MTVKKKKKKAGLFLSFNLQASLFIVVTEYNGWSENGEGFGYDLWQWHWALALVANGLQPKCITLSEETVDGTRLPTWLLGPPAESSGLVTKSVKFSLCYAWKFLLLLSETNLTGRICKRYLLFSFVTFFATEWRINLKYKTIFLL